MGKCPLYNGTNLNYTGTANPYALIQKGGKRKSRKARKNGKSRRFRNY